MGLDRLVWGKRIALMSLPICLTFAAAAAAAVVVRRLR